MAINTQSTLKPERGVKDKLFLNLLSKLIQLQVTKNLQSFIWVKLSAFYRIISEEKKRYLAITKHTMPNAKVGAEGGPPSTPSSSKSKP